MKRSQHKSLTRLLDDIACTKVGLTKRPQHTPNKTPRSTKQVIYEALPGAAYRLKDRAYIVDSRGCIRRVDIPKELMNLSTPTPVGNQVSEPVFIPHVGKASS